MSPAVMQETLEAEYPEKHKHVALAIGDVTGSAERRGYFWVPTAPYSAYL